jgi:hypothetical protein
MVMRTALIRVITFVLLAAGGVLCQKSSATDLLGELHVDGLNPSESQRQEMRTWRSLPDAPSPVEPPTQDTIGAVGIGAGFATKAGLAHLTLGTHPSSIFRYQSVPVQKESGASAFLDRYLRPPPLKQDQLHSLSAGSGSFVNRSCYAASRIFITRDDSGKARMNTLYFLGVLTAAALHTASRPYWAQSASATFNEFGSTIGGNAGVNVFHEFEPGIRQMVKGHIPRFVSRVEERITADHIGRDGFGTPTR